MIWRVSILSLQLPGCNIIVFAIFIYSFIIFFRKAIIHYTMRKANALLKEKMGFEISELEPVKSARKCTIPVLILHGLHDDFVQIKHAERIFNEYSGKDKRLIKVFSLNLSISPFFFLTLFYISHTFLSLYYLDGGES